MRFNSSSWSNLFLSLTLSFSLPVGFLSSLPSFRLLEINLELLERDDDAAGQLKIRTFSVARSKKIEEIYGGSKYSRSGDIACLYRMGQKYMGTR